MFVYMQVSGITGVGQPPRPDWVWLEVCRFGWERTQTSTELTEAKPGETEPKVTAVSKPVTIEKVSDRATPKLLAWMNAADPRKVTVQFCLVPTEPLIEVKLVGARLRSYNASFDNTQQEVREVLMLIYDEVALNYKETGATNRRTMRSGDFAHKRHRKQA